MALQKATESEFQNLSSIQLLLKKGADPNTVVNKNTGQTILMWAHQKGHLSLFKTLLKMIVLTF